MPARYARNQRNRNASERAGRKVGKAESKRLAEYRVETASRSGKNGFPVRVTYPKGKVTEDGYNRIPDSANRRRTLQMRVLREQVFLENLRKKKTKKPPSALKQREMPGWPDNTPNQRGLRAFKVL